MGPSEALIKLTLDMKQHNLNFGYQRIAMQIHVALEIEINKDIVRRVLAKYGRSSPKGSGPSWLTFIGQMKDSL